MQGLDQILGGSGLDLGALGQRFGLSPEQTQSAMAALMPAVLGGLHKQEQAGGLDQVTAAAAQGPADADTGNGVLGQIFGSKDVSRQVADHASDQSGVPAGVLKAMLPIVAAMVARHAAQQGGGGLGGLIGQVLGGAGGQAGGGGLGGLGGLAGMLGGGGNPLDAILGRR